MSSYKDLNLNKIDALAERARSLICGTDVFDGMDYIGTDNNPESQLKGYRLIEKLYKEIEPFIDEIKADLCVHDCWAFSLIINTYEKDAKYVLEAEEELEPQPKKPNKPEYIGILPDELIDEAINAGLIERTENGLRWMKTASLYGYFVDKVSKKLELKSSGGRIQWKVFRFIENHDTLLNTARQAVNDYTNKHLNPPEGDDIIDKILKDI